LAKRLARDEAQKEGWERTRNKKAFSASSAPWATRRVRVAAHPTPMTAKIGKLSRKKLIIYPRVATISL
jgi:hypothetical protein